MPDVKVRHPDHRLTNPQEREAFMERVAELVATHMTCKGYDGKLNQVTPDQIDVELISYKQENVRFGATLVIEICAYDYPDRMRDMADRLQAIGEGIVKLDVAGYDALVQGKKTVSLSYLPIPNGCWVAVD